MSKKHMGSGIDDFLKEEGIFEEAQTQAVKEVVAWYAVELAAGCSDRRTPSHDRVGVTTDNRKKCGLILSVGVHQNTCPINSQRQ